MKTHEEARAEAYDTVIARWKKLAADSREAGLLTLADIADAQAKLLEDR